MDYQVVVVFVGFITCLGSGCCASCGCSFTSTCLMIGFALASVWGLTGLFSIPP